MPPQKVFISYAWESDEFKHSVWELATWIVKKGEGKIEVEIDQKYSITAPPEGWPAWMTKQVKQSDIVLIVCSPKYCRRFEKKESNPDTGRGVLFEGAIITQELYNSQLNNTRFYPILPDNGIPSHVPSLLLSWHNNHRFPSGNENILKLLFKENPTLGFDLKTAKIVKDEKEITLDKNTQPSPKQRSSKKKTVNGPIKATDQPLIEPAQNPTNNSPANESEKELAAKKSSDTKKIKPYLILLFLLLILGLTTLFFIMRNRLVVTSRQKTKIIEIIHNYFKDVNFGRLSSEKYCAHSVSYYSHIGNYIPYVNLTPEELDQKLQNEAKEYMYQSISVHDPSFDFAKQEDGNISVDFNVQFLCFRKSITQYDEYNVDKEFIFSPNLKIISIKEISNHRNENLSFTAPEK